jgi:hypothetical protein
VFGGQDEEVLFIMLTSSSSSSEFLLFFLFLHLVPPPYVLEGRRKAFFIITIIDHSLRALSCPISRMMTVIPALILRMYHQHLIVDDYRIHIVILIFFLQLDSAFLLPVAPFPFPFFLVDSSPFLASTAYASISSLLFDFSVSCSWWLMCSEEVLILLNDLSGFRRRCCCYCCCCESEESATEGTSLRTMGDRPPFLILGCFIVSLFSVSLLELRMLLITSFIVVLVLNVFVLVVFS